MKQMDKWWPADEGEESDLEFPAGTDVTSFMQLIVIPVFVALALLLAGGLYLFIE